MKKQVKKLVSKAKKVVKKAAPKGVELNVEPKVEAEVKLERPVKKVKFFRRLDCLKHNPNNEPFLRSAWENGATFCLSCDKYYLKGKEISAERVER